MTGIHDENEELIKEGIQIYIEEGGNPCNVLEYLIESMRTQDDAKWNYAANELEVCIIKMATAFGDGD